MSIQITPGSTQLSPKLVTAHGKEQSRMTATRFAGVALLALIVIYGAAFLARGVESHDLTGLIGTAFGIFAGRYLRNE